MGTDGSLQFLCCFPSLSNQFPVCNGDSFLLAGEEHKEEAKGKRKRERKGKRAAFPYLACPII